jgi:hypothetical protein
MADGPAKNWEIVRLSSFGRDRRDVMVKANLTLRDGTQVTIEGAPDEVRQLLELIGSAGDSDFGGQGSTRKTTRASSRRQGPQALISELANDGFFNQKRTIGEVQKALAGHGHIYALNSLSSPLVRLVRSRELRRIKEGSKWMYVNP